MANIQNVNQLRIIQDDDLENDNAAALAAQINIEDQLPPAERRLRLAEERADRNEARAIRAGERAEEYSANLHAAKNCIIEHLSEIKRLMVREIESIQRLNNAERRAEMAEAKVAQLEKEINDVIPDMKRKTN